MILTRNYSRIAVLTDDLINKLIEKYKPYSPYHIRRGEYEDGDIINFVKWIHNKFSELTNKADLLTEWMLKSLYRHSGRPEDIERFINSARFYFDHIKEDRYKQIIREFARTGTNPKNILDFTLHDLEEIRELYEQPPVDPRVNQLQGKLPGGSSLLYNDNKYQIIQVISSQAACELARGTKWCTSKEETAEHYLGISPLYIIYFNGKKLGQLHIDKESGEFQFMDLKDNHILNIDEGLRGALIKSGLMEQILSVLEKRVQYYINHSSPTYIYRTLEEFERYAGNPPPPIISSLLLKYPLLVETYEEYSK